MQCNDIEKKWVKQWTDARIYEVDCCMEKCEKKGKKKTEKRKKKFITAAFPYPNSPQHIGHARTYTTTDIYARYWRLRGYNVLFPMAFHVTGTPILAMAKKIAERNEEVLSVFEDIYGISRESAAGLTTPESLAMYFSKEIEEGMKEIGYAIDWRRRFYSFDGKFNRFIEWQFKKLNEFGLLVQGEHVVPWCPKDNNAVGAHDTKGDVDPEMKEFIAIKFAFKDGYLLTATLRPETIYGVINIWVNPKSMHVRAKSKKTNEIFYISKKACEKMNSQGFELEVMDELKVNELIGKNALNIVTGKAIPIYAAEYVNDSEGTGIVMSVPSHAPYDHISLVGMGLHINYTQIIQVEGYKFMAQELLEQRGIKDQHDPRIEDIVKEVYKKEILTGIMLIGPYKGEKVSVAIEKTTKDMLARKQALSLWEINNKPVYCRCGAEVIANVVRNQWFINYGDEKLKEKARDCIAAMSIIPEKNRADYLYVIGWLREKACTRAAGLGTRFPFDKTQMIEALSDSTVYMAFYTIAHLLNEIPESEMTEEFFDYVFCGRGKGGIVAKKCRESFLYWYPIDSRHSGADLMRNHLPFFIMNHVVIFQKEHWPKQIAVNGFVLMDGKKMSKSIGNILPLRKAIREYGADIIRFSVVSGADLTQDTDFNKTVAEGTRNRVEYFKKMITESAKTKITSHKRIEKWLLSRLNRKIKMAGEFYEKLALRELALEIFYGVYDDLKWYGKRTSKHNLHDFFKKWVVLIAPFMPHYAEEFWHKLGGEGFVVNAQFPDADEKAIDDRIEQGEELVRSVREDIENIEKILNRKPKKIHVFIANEIKRDIYALIAREKKFDLVLNAAKANAKLKTKMDVVQRIVKLLIKNAHSLPKILSSKEELNALNEAEEFFRKEFRCTISIEMEDIAKHERAKNALPNKPSIAFE